MNNWIRIDLDAPIFPCEAAAGIHIGDDVRKLLAFATPDEVSKLTEFTIFRFGPVKVWSSSHLVTQIGVYSGYRGTLSNRIGLGSTIGDVERFYGRKVIEDDDDNLIVADSPGWCFETEEWLGNHSIEENVSRRITEIFVFKPRSVTTDVRE